MNYEKFKRIEFEYRIFFSLGIVIFICLLSFIYFPDSDSIIANVGQLFWIAKSLSTTIYFLLLSLVMIVVSLLRMWSGSILSSSRVMSFKVQSNVLLQEGPYLLVRNPIYLADYIAITSCSLCLPPIGLLMPILFYLHYSQLIKYEERGFAQKFANEIESYYRTVPRLFPSPKSAALFLKSDKTFEINYDGFRHNALYLLFIPGFIAAAITNSFVVAILIGFPGIIDWAIIHTRIGYKRESKQLKKTDTLKRNKKTKKIFDDILYAQCWEDPQIDREALSINRNDTVFSITSGGCNVLTFLLDDPEEIIALDLSAYQNYLLELKIALFRQLPYKNILEFIGVRRSAERIKVYMKLRSALSENCRAYWDKNLKKIKKGIIHCGRYEKYMNLVRLFITAAIGEKIINRLFEEEDSQKRLELYNDKVQNIRWRIATKFILSKKVMSLLFDKDFFKYLGDSFTFGDHFSEKAKHAFTELPMKKNYFLSYILLGKYFSEDHLPIYLRRENYDFIKSRINRITIITDNCGNYLSTLPDNMIDKFNMSNVFEWMSENEFYELLNEVCRVGRNNGVVIYRNLLVRRESTKMMRNKLYPMKNLAESLHQKDLSFIYNHYVIEKIIKEDKKCATESAKFQLEMR